MRSPMATPIVGRPSPLARREDAEREVLDREVGLWIVGRLDPASERGHGSAQTADFKLATATLSCAGRASALSGEEPVEEPRVEHPHEDHHQIGRIARDDAQIAKLRRNAESDDPGVETHAKASECFWPHATDEKRADGHADRHARQDLRNQTDAARRDESRPPVGDCRHARFGQPHESERRAEFCLGETLIAQRHGEWWSGNRGDRIEHADAATEHEARRSLRANRPAISGGLKEDEREQREVSRQLQISRIDARHDHRADDDAGRQADHDGEHPAPDHGQRPPIDPEHPRVERDLDEDERGVQNTIGQKEQRERDSDRREAVTQRAVDGRGDKRNDEELQEVRRHLTGRLSVVAELQSDAEIVLAQHVHGSLEFVLGR